MTPHLTLSKKLLSILLSLLLAVAFVPAVAFAGNDANDEAVTFDEDVTDRPVYDADDSFGGVDDSDFGGVDSSDGGTEITTWPDPSGSDNGTTENNQGTQEGKELKENSWRYTNGELTVSDESEDAGIEAYSTRSNSNKRPVARGIDVSEHNGTINWNAVKNSGQVDFAILRVGYGDDYSYQDDKQWARNVSECERLGIPYGVYIYSYATSWSQLNSEVSHVKRLLRGHNPSYPVYIDMEDDSTIGLGRNTLTQFAKSFCDQINSAGYTAGVYANLNWWNNHLNASQLDNYERWVAQYNSSCWYEGDYSLWQYSSSGSVPGISGNVDMNYDYANRTRNLEYSSISAQGMARNATGSALKPEVSITLGGRTLKEGTDYTLSYNDSSSAPVKAGEYTVEAKGINSYEGEIAIGKMVIYDSLALEDTSYIIRSCANSNLVLDAAGFVPESGSNVSVYKSNGGLNQSWMLKAESEGYYTIRSCANSNLVLDAAGFVPESGSNVSVYKSNSGLNQKWVLASQSNGGYRIINAANSNLVLDAAGFVPESGSNVSVYKSNGGLNQSWMLER